MKKESRREVRQRLGNRDLSDLIASEAEMRTEAAKIAEVIKNRMMLAHPVIVGHSYRITSGRYKGRRILVSQKIVERGERWMSEPDRHWVVTIHGPLSDKYSKMGDGYNIKHVVLWNSTLDLASGEPGPRKFKQWHHKDDVTDED